MILAECFIDKDKSENGFYIDGLQITGILPPEGIWPNDFELIEEAIYETPRGMLKTGEWYRFTLDREWQSDGAGVRNDPYFIVIAREVVEELGNNKDKPF